jgi:iron(III) transport system substrate-binding protein
MRLLRHAHLALFATALAALVLTACGGTDDTADPTSTDATTDPASTEGTTDPMSTDQPADDATDEATDEAAAAGPITVYSGRNEELVGQVFDDFTDATGIEVEVRYGDTAELAATILEEGDASPADVYFAQDAGALGALEGAGRFTTLPGEVLEVVDPAFRAPSGAWTGVTGRVRVLAYNTDTLSADDLPDSVLDLTDPAWSGRVGWAPTNGSFQAFVTALRLTQGEDVARDWLEGMLANDVVPFENNAGIIEAVARGEVEVGLVNHYYLYRFLAEDPDFNVDNKYLPGDIGGLVNIAGAGILGTSDEQQAAEELIRYLLSEEVQEYFGQVTDELEFPVRTGVESPELPTLEEIDPPDVDLSDLEDLQGTLELLREVGALS